MKSKKDLWLHLRNYQFDQLVPAHLADHVRSAFGGRDASTRAFADKLARKLNWRNSFALQAIDEYKKFVYLGMVADFPVTPPKVIDQVWHEHLLFSSGYRAFCADVLGRDFDHNPELVPLDEQTAAFQAQYAATLDLYRTEFNRVPPAQFWGVPKFAGRPEPALAQTPLRRRDDGSNYGDVPLYAAMGSSDGGSHGSQNMPEFGGGSPGSHGGGGTWPDSTSHGAPSDSTSSGHGDSGGGGDGGSGGGSGCSSGCGGGCGSL